MKVSISWLREYVDITRPIEEIAALLTASGNEAWGIHRTGGDWEQVQVAQVVRLEQHPNADRLRLATVDLGGQEKTVVCGAPNIAVGQKIAFAQVGARLRDGHTGEPTVLQAARIRGVVSEGMVCSERELGLSDEYEGILVLPEDAPVGTPLQDYMGDIVLEIDVTPNRPDCLSALGIAREIAVLTGQPLREPDSSYPEAGPPAQSQATVEILGPDLCFRYTASLVTGVKIGPSPGWMQERLSAAGMRPINNVVDITNYVMLEMGQPLHAFDYRRIRDRKIVVRRAGESEKMTTLDGVERIFTSNQLLICDGGGPVALGGIIGGLDSEVTPDTTDILLESANFNHTNIRQSETALRISTEASRRFDKGLNQESAEAGLRRATKLLVELCGGAAAQGIIDTYPTRRQPVTITLTQQRLSTVLGAPVSGGRASEILTALGCQVSGELERGLQAVPPWWRPDLSIPDDLVEEVARIVGYDTLPTSTLRGAVPHATPNPMLLLKDRARDLLTAAGLQEVLNYSLTSLTNLQKIAPHPVVERMQPLKVANPMSAEQEYLRTSLRPGILANLAANERHSAGRLQAFEIGKVFLPQEADLPREQEYLVGLLAGEADGQHWAAVSRPLTFYDAKGVLEALFRELGVQARFQTAEDANLHPGRTAEITANGQAFGVLGELHPEVAARFDIQTEPVYLFEIDLEALVPHVRERREYHPISRYPGVTEDLAVLVDADVPGAAVEASIRSTRLVADVRLFDVYTGAQVPAGKKSLAYSITYQAPDHTLQGEEVARIRQGLLQRLAGEHGARLRE